MTVTPDQRVTQKVTLQNPEEYKENFTGAPKLLTSLKKKSSINKGTPGS
jgi:hypothetical protein